MAKKYQSYKKKAQGEKKPRPTYDYDLKVIRVFDGKYGVLFDLEINHVTIYGCRMCETRDGQPFVGFPQKQDRKDKDKWWSIAYAPLTEAQVQAIWDQIGAKLEEEEDDDE